MFTFDSGQHGIDPAKITGALVFDGCRLDEKLSLRWSDLFYRFVFTSCQEQQHEKKREKLFHVAKIRIYFLFGTKLPDIRMKICILLPKIHYFCNKLKNNEQIIRLLADVSCGHPLTSC
jgi:hypothetical protein